MHLENVTVVTAAGIAAELAAGGEDASAGASTPASPALPEEVVETLGARNTRRHTLVIWGSCESCGNVAVGLKQHKGVTSYSAVRWWSPMQELEDMIFSSAYFASGPLKVELEPERLRLAANAVIAAMDEAGIELTVLDPSVRDERIWVIRDDLVPRAVADVL